ncbi:hypothetical protein BUZ25_12420, partial [Staphylococcus haemolyticus]
MAGLTIDVTVDGSTVGAATIVGNNWSKVLPTLPTGSHTIAATADDHASTSGQLAYLTQPTAPTLSGQVYYIAPTGSDTNPGTYASPKQHFGAFYTDSFPGFSPRTGALQIQQGSVIRCKSGTYTGHQY